MSGLAGLGRGLGMLAASYAVAVSPTALGMRGQRWSDAVQGGAQSAGMAQVLAQGICRIGGTCGGCVGMCRGRWSCGCALVSNLTGSDGALAGWADVLVGGVGRMAMAPGGAVLWR